MYHSLEYLIDFIFPPSPEARAVRTLTPHDCSQLYQESQTNEVTALTDFSNYHVRALIHEAKFHGSVRAQKLLAGILDAYIMRHPRLLSALWIPTSLSSLRIRMRGYNQVTEILRYTAGETTRLNILDHVLVRVRDTIPQTTLARDARIVNMRNAFAAKNPKLISGRDIVILDDVTTTGATLHAAKAALLPHGPASITLIALAH